VSNLMSVRRAIGARGLFVICALAAFYFGSTVPARPSVGLTSAASASAAGSQTSTICAVPTVSGVAYHPGKGSSGATTVAPNAASSGTVVVTGANFVGACNRTVQIGGATFSNAVLGVDMTGAQTLAIKLNPSKPLPAAASGAVSVTLSDWQGGANSSNTGTVRVYNLIQTPAAQPQDASVPAGATEHVSGNAFTPFAQSSSGGLAGAQVVGTYPACAGSPQFRASVVGDSALALGTPVMACNSRLDLMFVAPAYTDPAPASNPHCGTSPSVNCIKVTVTAGNVNVLFNGSGSSGGGGSTPSPGGPSGGTGNTNSGSPVNSQSGANTPAANSGVLGNNHTTANNPATANHHATANNQVMLSVTSTQSTPGSTVDFTVTFVVDGRPVSGAPVTLILLSAPRSDATVTPAQGVTDGRGQLRGKLHLSRSAGDHLLLARSGIYSDQINVFGAIPTEKTAGGDAPLGIDRLHIDVSGNPLVIWLSVACVVLVILGILVNLEVLGVTLLQLTIIRPIARLRRRPPAGGAIRR
jgi:hypothetical protein